MALVPGGSRGAAAQLPQEWWAWPAEVGGHQRPRSGVSPGVNMARAVQQQQGRTGVRARLRWWDFAVVTEQSAEVYRYRVHSGLSVSVPTELWQEFEQPEKTREKFEPVIRSWRKSRQGQTEA